MLGLGPASGSGGGHDAPAAPPPAAAPPKPPPPPKPRPEPPPPRFPAVPPGPPAPARVHIVVDAVSGMAIGGYDPVAYFLEGQPHRGVDDFQVDWARATWLFSSEGNLIAFKDRPDVYAPVFGGYCPYAIAQGFPTEGHPAIFALIGQRLHLFATVENRTAYLAGGKAVVDAAMANWPRLSAFLP